MTVRKVGFQEKQTLRRRFVYGVKTYGKVKEAALSRGRS